MFGDLLAHVVKLLVGSELLLASCYAAQGSQRVAKGASGTFLAVLVGCEDEGLAVDSVRLVLTTDK